ncbi:hypothetical protein [Pyrobaculum aerophilum]|uniref:Uncharacterized protein n=2 Tax=Pyrobaculum aerophilum TaxID=13773 RepID=Q8ZY10_PYRAE|nr:hypothetical protein [Pyrobaculum aerophilum]AAL63186.1 hypothetical protein PAE0996 [Pyrobaculum aerophilum str. IM2]MCX8136156.1 hypothetical protein [Pyrobaculum aerophilum]HII48053.1 hypothetical protein [Pyrobaculum aerophilum]
MKISKSSILHGDEKSRMDRTDLDRLVKKLDRDFKKNKIDINRIVEEIEEFYRGERLGDGIEFAKRIALEAEHLTTKDKLKIQTELIRRAYKARDMREKAYYTVAAGQMLLPNLTVSHPAEDWFERLDLLAFAIGIGAVNYEIKDGEILFEHAGRKRKIEDVKIKNSNQLVTSQVLSSL